MSAAIIKLCLVAPSHVENCVLVAESLAGNSVNASIIKIDIFYTRQPTHDQCMMGRLSFSYLDYKFWPVYKSVLISLLYFTLGSKSL